MSCPWAVTLQVLDDADILTEDLLEPVRLSNYIIWLPAFKTTVIFVQQKNKNKSKNSRLDHSLLTLVICCRGRQRHNVRMLHFAALFIKPLARNNFACLELLRCLSFSMSMAAKKPFTLITLLASLICFSDKLVSFGLFI